MLKFRRKSGQPNTQNRGAGELVVIPKGMSRARAFKERMVYAPGDVIEVERIEDVPGYPHQMDGWEQLAYNDTPVSMDGTERPAKLRARHKGRGFWEVVIEVQGTNYKNAQKSGLLGVGEKIHEGMLSRARAEEWAKTGTDPGPDF